MKVSIENNYTNERAMWNEFFGLNAGACDLRRETRRQFKELNPEGHDTSIRCLVENFLERSQNNEVFNGSFEYTNNVHPRAWNVILDHGKDYRPISFRGTSVHSDEKQPEPANCFFNAFEMMYALNCHVEGLEATYVEGFAAGPVVPPMLHAWNGVGFSKNALDWTFYTSTMWTRYFGIPFTCEEYEFMREAANPGKPQIGMLFREDCFESVESAMLEVLKRPRTRLIQKIVAGV